MFDAIEVSNASEIQVTKTLSIVLVGDLQNTQPSYRLNGKKLLEIISICSNLSKRERQIWSSSWY